MSRLPATVGCRNCRRVFPWAEVQTPQLWCASCFDELWSGRSERRRTHAIVAGVIIGVLLLLTAPQAWAISTSSSSGSVVGLSAERPCCGRCAWLRGCSDDPRIQGECCGDEWYGAPVKGHYAPGRTNPHHDGARGRDRGQED